MNTHKLKLYSEDKEITNLLNELQTELNLIPSDKEGVRLAWVKQDAKKIELQADTEDELTIIAKDIPHFIQGLSFYLRQEKPKSAVFDYSFHTKGFFLDSSRNAVVNVQTIKQMLRKMAVLGYNRFYLYMEDVYEVPSEPYFGLYRGAYTNAELQEIDQYGLALGIEVIPAIQVMAHLDQFLKWEHIEDKYADIDDTLNVGREATFELVEAMFQAISANFTSPHIHLGMDEAFFLGRGSYIEEFGPKTKKEIMHIYLDKLTPLFEKYQIEPIIWDDMFFGGSQEASQEQFKTLDDKINLMYWDYYSQDQENYEVKIDMRKELTDNISFAGAAWKWLGYAPHHKKTLYSSIAALQACKAKGIPNVIVTTWGDDTSEAPMYVALFGVVLYAYMNFADKYDEAEFNDWLIDYTGEDFDAWVKQGEFDLLDHFDEMNALIVNPSKYFLYQDLLTPVFKNSIEAIGTDYGAHMHELAQFFREKTTGDPLVNAFYATFATCLENKWDLPLAIAKAYEAKDKEQLTDLIENRLQLLTQQLRDVLSTRRKLWLAESKPQGIEILDYRFGAMLIRVDTTIERLNDFIAGNIDKIEEIEQVYLDPTPYNEHSNHQASHAPRMMGIMSKNKYT